MPSAPSDFLKVYLAGLSFAENESDNGIEKIGELLNIDTKFIFEAYAYWKEQGLVDFTIEPMSATYLPVLSKSEQPSRKYPVKKYKDFVDRFQAIVPENFLLANELKYYYDFMDYNNIDPATMIEIIGYCILRKGDSFKPPYYHYILTVANSLLKDNYRTFDKVKERLGYLELLDSDIMTIHKTLNSKKIADIQDKEMFEKWKNEFKFSLGIILSVARKVKVGGIKTLDMLLTRYHENGLNNILEIEEFENKRKDLYALVKKITKILGLRYDNLDYIVENYATNWLSYGLDNDVLIAIAKQLFEKNNRNVSIPHYDEQVEKFYKDGLKTLEDVKKIAAPLPKPTIKKTENFVSRTLSADETNDLFGKLDDTI